MALAEDPTPPAPPADPAGDDGGDGRRRGLTALIVLLAVLVLAALIGGAVLLAQRPSAAPSTSASPPAHSSAPASASPRPTSASPSPTPSSPSPSPTPTETPSATPTPTATPEPTASSSSAPASGTPTSAQLADAIRSYFALLPGNTDAAWNRLTPAFQQGKAQGRAYYDEFWGRYRSVTATDVSGSAPDEASATLTYVANDGTRTVEHDTFRLVRQGGVLKIDSETTG